MPKLNGVVIAALLTALVAIFGTLTAVSVLAQTPTGNQGSRLGYDIGFTLIALITALAWCVAVGLFRGAGWARIGCIALGIEIALLGLLGCLGIIAVLLKGRWSLNHTWSALAVVTLLFFLLTVLGVWLIVYFSTPSVRQAFRGHTVYVPDTLAYPELPYALRSTGDALGSPGTLTAAHGYIAIPLHGMPQSREGMSVVRGIVVFSAIFFLLASLMQIRNVIFGHLFFYFGLTLRRHAGPIALIAYSVFLLVTAIGLLRRLTLAYYVAIFFSVCNIVSEGLLLFPKYRATAFAAGTLYAVHSRSHNWFIGTWVLSFLVYTCIDIVIIWALWNDRAARREPAPLAIEPGL